MTQYTVQERKESLMALNAVNAMGLTYSLRELRNKRAPEDSDAESLIEFLFAAYLKAKDMPTTDRNHAPQKEIQDIIDAMDKQWQETDGKPEGFLWDAVPAMLLVTIMERAGVFVISKPWYDRFFGQNFTSLNDWWKAELTGALT